ncbi:MAG: protein kinase domain-containing protein [Vicinamibacterales bacterium]
MSLAPGNRLGPYEVLDSLGAGGMGEVYRARDTQLKREVALKVLPEAFAQDPDRLARFQREAELLATLNHPNIAAVYGLEKAADVTGIVLELIEGETLAERIGRGGSSAFAEASADRRSFSGGRSDPPSRISGESKDSPLQLDEALAIARQIADARIELDEPPHSEPAFAEASSGRPDSRRTTSVWARAIPWALGVIAGGVVAGVAVWSVMRGETATRPALQRYPITLPASAPYVGEAGGELAISPTGQTLAYVGLDGGKRTLYLRHLDQLVNRFAAPTMRTTRSFRPMGSG